MGFVFLFSPCTGLVLRSNFACGYQIEMMPYVIKNIKNVYGYFHKLGIFNTKLILEIQNCMKVIVKTL